MEVAVQIGTVAAHDQKAAQKIAAARARDRVRRDGPASDGRPWWEAMQAAHPGAVVTNVEPVH